MGVMALEMRTGSDQVESGHALGDERYLVGTSARSGRNKIFQNGRTEAFLQEIPDLGPVVDAAELEFSSALADHVQVEISDGLVQGKRGCVAK